MNRAARTRRYGWWYVAEQRLMLLKFYWTSLLVVSLGSPAIYLFGLGVGLGLVVDSNQGNAGVDGVPYLVFVAPALVFSSVMVEASDQNTWAVFGGFKWMRHFDAQYSTPLTPAQMAIGFQLGSVITTMCYAACYSVAIAIAGIVDLGHALMLLPVAALLSTAVGFAVCSWVSSQEDDRGQLNFVQRFVITPLALFSGTFYPLSILPVYLQWIGWLSPLWHATQLGRYVLYGSKIAPWLVAVHVVFLVGLAAVCCWLTIRVFERRLNK